MYYLNISLHLNPCPQLPNLFCSSESIRQSIQNLLFGVTINDVPKLLKYCFFTCILFYCSIVKNTNNFLYAKNICIVIFVMLRKINSIFNKGLFSLIDGSFLEKQVSWRNCELATSQLSATKRQLNIAVCGRW